MQMTTVADRVPGSDYLDNLAKCHRRPLTSHIIFRLRLTRPLEQTSTT